MTLDCEHVELLIEDLAAGERAMDAAMAAHLGVCPACAARLELARGIELALRTRPVRQPGPDFTALVMARVREDHWRAEEVVDLGFNLALAAGALLIVAGLAGVAWSLGLISVGPGALALLGTVADLVLQRTTSEAPTVLAAVVLLTLTLGAWWWAEHELSV